MGLSLAYFDYRRDLPLTIRSALTPIFGRSLSGPLGHVIDVVAVVATVLGAAQTLGFGVEQFVSGLTRLGFDDWPYTVGEDGAQTMPIMAIVVALTVIMGGSTLSALSGVGKGIKSLSNIHTGLSFFIQTFFLIFGSIFFGLQAFFLGGWDDFLSIPSNIFTVWGGDGVEGSVASELNVWQGGWTIFYRALGIAFAPFVGVVLARANSACIRAGGDHYSRDDVFVWFAIVGGTAIDLKLNGNADGAITGAGRSDQLFAMLAVMLEPTLAWAMSLVVVVVLLTYLVTSADSAVLIINIITAAGDKGPKARPHITFWGVALALVVGGLIIAGGLGAIQTAMVIGALPFSLVMALMGLSVLKAIRRDGRREKVGVPATSLQAAAVAPAE